MNNSEQLTTTHWRLAAIAALGLITVSGVDAEDDSQAATTAADRGLLETEVTESFVNGYTIPDRYRDSFTEVPAVEGGDLSAPHRNGPTVWVNLGDRRPQPQSVIVQYRRGRAYHVSTPDWEIVLVVDLDPFIEARTEDDVFIKGYVIPENTRNRFVEVPRPSADSDLTVQYYDNTAYYVDSSFCIRATRSLVP